MTPKHLCILLLALVAVSGVVAQSEDIPIENDNQFPPENPAEPVGDTIEGSGDGTVEEPLAETTPVPRLEEIQPTEAVLQSAVVIPQEDQTCPIPCVCHYEGENFVVDCSGYDLTQFPSPIDLKTTTLNLQNNKLTEIPKDVSLLKNLKVLNAENNQIMDLALGSVSDMPELTVLKLGNNRLIEYPMDLKNSLSLTKLEELDLGGNDMRGELKPEILSNFKSLRKLTLATTTSELLQDLCDSLKDTLEFVCTDSCNDQMFECQEALPQMSDEHLLNATLPGAFPIDLEDSDPDINSANTEEPSVNSGTEDTSDEASVNSVTESKQQAIDPASIRVFGGALLDNDGHQQENNAEETVAKNVDNKQNLQSRKYENPEADVAVGATTSEGSNGGGGVSKSVIGIIVAAMVVVVAAISITKNWNSIKRKFSSSPRPADHAEANGNGTTLPEEVPLQDKDKSPV